MLNDGFAGIWSDGDLTACAWMLTYVLHSTLLLGGVWLVTRAMASTYDQVKERLWKCALVGGLVTATLQVGIGLEPWSGHWTLSRRDSIELIPACHSAPVRCLSQNLVPAASTTHDRLRLGLLSGRPDVGRQNPTPPPAVQPRGEPQVDQENWAAGPTGMTQSAVPAKSSGPSTLDWRELVPVLLLLMVGLGLGLAGLGRLRLRSRLAGRTEITDGPLPAMLRRLYRGAGLHRSVRLTCSQRVTAPMAIGIRRPEICLPERAVSSLTTEQHKCMLAHELAHLVRRDPAWLSLCQVLTCVFFFQPLNRLARRRLQELAEYACDAWAVERTGGSLPLARCLTEVAAWLLASQDRLTPVTVARMAENESTLKRRIRRLLDEGERRSREIRRGPLGLILVGLLASVTIGVPGFSAGQECPEKKMPAAPTSRPVARHGANPAAPPLAEALEKLSQELSQLDTDIAALRKELRNSPLNAESGELIDLLEQQSRQLHERHERLVERLPEIIPAISADPPGSNRTDLSGKR